MSGDLDLAALGAAWREVAGRHETLRTTLAEAGGRPVRSIAAGPPAAPSFTDLRAAAPSFTDLRAATPPTGDGASLVAGHVADPRSLTGTAGEGVSPAVDEAAALRWCAEQAATPFDLAEGPPARLAVARLGDGEHAVALVLHRAAADDRSLSILAHELAAHYAAALTGGPEEGAPAARPVGGAPSGGAQTGLPVGEALPPQYAEFARWQREPAGAAELRRLRDWWISALAPAPASPALPVDRARPAGPSFHGDQVRFDWGRDLARDLAALARAEGTTPFAVLLAAVQCLLGRYGREDRPVVGATAAFRPPGFEDAIGPFDDLLVLRGDLSGRPAFREVLRRAARLADAAHEHRGLPFGELVRAVNPGRDPYRVPMCDVMLVHRDLPEPEFELPGAVVRPVPVGNGSARTDLALVVDRAAPSVTGCLEYRDSLFDRMSARHMLRQLRTLLAAALREPDLPIDELPMEDAIRIGAAVREADLTGAAVEDGPPVHELVHLRARGRQDAVAVAWDGAEVSYREIEELAAPVTAALRAGDGVEGLPVAVRMPQGPRQAAALLGVLDAGAHLVCLGTGDTGERGKAVLADLVPACLVLDGEPAGDELAGWHHRELGGWILNLASPPPLTGALSSASAAPPSAGPETRAYVAYTSGSTGRPKGIPQSHAALAHFVTWFAGEFGIGPGARVAQWAAPGYDASLVEIFATLAAGATLCPVPDRIRANPDRMAGWLAAERITHFQTVPSFARQLLGALAEQDPAQNPVRNAGPLPELTHLLLAGEPLAGELANGLRTALPGARLVNLYGPTEAILATWHEITGPVYGVAPIGRSIPGRQVLVLDDQDRPCPAGVTGHLVIRSPHVTPGYAGAASGERSPFLPLRGFDPAHRAYRTGDLGRRRWDGTLEFGGRGDFQVKFNGVRMELTDIEAALAAHQSVAGCAVVAVPGPDGLVSRLVAYVVPRTAPDETAEATPDVWRAALRRRFGKAMPPVSFRTLDALPRNVGGKVDRNALPRPAPSTAGRAAKTSPTAVEREVAAVWSELLGADRVDAEVSFFAAGGNSLLIPSLLDRIRMRFGTAVSLPQFFADPTPAGLAALIEARSIPEKAVTQTMMG
ncbi:non-ribosomal peptide synthetase [Sphaerisporangium perillae]|uniref:non-ribosomal peptide synthetase n=1 Tax=Sphaerisporangium perillae TaxID=2935860 RepID=UPI0020101DA7|nr:AMP-binding protein [Sphaerisporangium perillae]